MGSGAIIRAEQAGEVGVTIREEFDGREVTRSAETASSAVVAQQQAMVQARFIMAWKRPRHWNDIRKNIKELCLDPDFAAEALYVKPIAKTPDNWNDWSKRERLQRAPENWPRGFSIRFLESFMFEAGNFDVKTLVIWEDEDKRMTDVIVIDLERNSAYSRTVTTLKTVERSSLRKGQVALDTRTNSWGNVVYILPATDDEVNLKEASGVSKAIRTLSERLMPPHLKREWRDLIEKVIMDENAKDPQAAKKRLMDSFGTQGVAPSALDEYLGHSIDTATPAEMIELRGVYVALANGDANWKDALRFKSGEGEDEPGAAAANSALSGRIDAQRKRAEEPTQGKPAGAATGAGGAAGATTQTATDTEQKQPEQKQQPEQGTTTAAPSDKPIEDMELIREMDKVEASGKPRPTMADMRKQMEESAKHAKKGRNPGAMDLK